MNIPIELLSLFEKALAQSASDLHLVAGETPRIRVYDELLPMEGATSLASNAIDAMLGPVFPQATWGALNAGTIPFAETLVPQGSHNFIVGMYRSSGEWSAAIRIIQSHVPTLTQIGGDCAPFFTELARTGRGLILITGPNGSGKQTTAFALLQEINQLFSRRLHLIEESPAHWLRSEKCLVSSLVVGQDIPDYDAALRLLSRGVDPDVIYLADIPTMDTIQAALSLVRSGHLVIANANAPSAALALDTIAQALPPALHPILAEHLVAVTNQRLMKKPSGRGRVPAYEVVQNSEELRDAIKTGLNLDIFLQGIAMGSTGKNTLPEVIAGLVRQETITEAAATAALQDYPVI